MDGAAREGIQEKEVEQPERVGGHADRAEGVHVEETQFQIFHPSPLEGDDRDVIFAVGRQLRELSSEAAVLLWAPRGDRGFRALMRTAGQVVWYYDERPATPARRRRREVQATLG